MIVLWNAESTIHACASPRILQVPESVHEAWRKGGTSRNALLQKLVEANFDKDSHWVYC